MTKWHLFSAAAALVLLAGCGSATDSDEYKALSVEAATTQSNLGQVQAKLDEALAERRKLEAKADRLQEFMDDTRATHMVDTETWRARQAVLTTRGDELKTRETELDAREQAVDDRAAAVTADKARAAMGEFGATGTYVAGKDMLPGNYFAPGGPNCQWAYLTGTGKGASVVMARQGLDVQYLAIGKGDVFRTKGCGPWIQ
jgi:outer membrane murein-binding lipoprotein Lpp